MSNSWAGLYLAKRVTKFYTWVKCDSVEWIWNVYGVGFIVCGRE